MLLDLRGFWPVRRLGAMKGGGGPSRAVLAENESLGISAHSFLYQATAPDGGNLPAYWPDACAGRDRLAAGPGLRLHRARRGGSDRPLAHHRRPATRARHAGVKGTFKGALRGAARKTSCCKFACQTLQKCLSRYNGFTPKLPSNPRFYNWIEHICGFVL